jgi:hypothetical protein
MSARGPTAGKVFRRKKQAYVSSGSSEVQTKDGRSLIVYVLRSKCHECGARFEFTAPITWIDAGKLRRRCDLHKARGRPILPRRTRRKGQRRRGKRRTAAERLQRMLS